MKLFTVVWVQEISEDSIDADMDGHVLGLAKNKDEIEDIINLNEGEDIFKSIKWKHKKNSNLRVGRLVIEEDFNEGAYVIQRWSV